ncbi:MAG: peptidylprolyl isomerase [Aggregatilineales bacterium]|nr:peptidylprolyl isomerase [Chloroflexota bacterium]HOA23961.1 peptidylprolyl isomerase [Aggregatilineales bacterium]HPV05701.1 peptidylprolyl isomerase [Aggregatilineales bacterium]
MTQAKIGDTVRVHYTGRFEDGTVFDTSQGREPIEFTLGEHEVIPGFENAVAGMQAGETKTTQIPPEDAYGERREDLLIDVPRAEVPADIDPQVGQTLQVQGAGGQVFPVVVASVGEDTITLDANHPLAGRSLIFDIHLIDIV